MAVAMVEQIEIARIGSTELLHGLGQIGLSGFQQKMIVIAHQPQTVRSNRPGVPETADDHFPSKISPGGHCPATGHDKLLRDIRFSIAVPWDEFITNLGKSVNVNSQFKV